MKFVMKLLCCWIAAFVAALVFSLWFVRSFNLSQEGAFIFGVVTSMLFCGMSTMAAWITEK